MFADTTEFADYLHRLAGDLSESGSTETAADVATAALVIQQQSGALRYLLDRAHLNTAEQAMCTVALSEVKIDAR